MNFDFIEGLSQEDINELFADENQLSYCNTGYNSTYRRTCWHHCHAGGGVYQCSTAPGRTNEGCYFQSYYGSGYSNCSYSVQGCLTGGC